MLRSWKGFGFPAKENCCRGGDQRCCSFGASFCILSLLSLAAICCLAFFYQLQTDYNYPWSRPAKADTDDARIPTNISHIVFGIGASAGTWNQRRRYIELWWRPGRARGHVWLDTDPPPGAWHASSPPYLLFADASRFGKRAAASRMARIVAESYRLHALDPGVRWFVMGDDDTVFFTDNLVTALGKYDHRQMYYVGAPSESVEQDEIHSYGMAFGGGGFAVSAPAAAALARNMDGCLDRYAQFYGSDQRVFFCLAELGVPLTREPGFHQLDIRGDAYGLLAAHPVAPLLSLHHLDYLAPITPQGADRIGALGSLINASRFDPARLLQQCFCYEAVGDGLAWSVSVSWGYTVQLYPRALPAKDLELPLRTFKTWRSSSDGPFTFKTRPFDPDDACERPLIYFLERVEERRGGGTDETVSEYARYGEKKGGACDRPGYDATAEKVETVTVFATKLALGVWSHEAPRRQCCRTRRTRRGRRLDVEIRSCQPGEITFPPQ